MESGCCCCCTIIKRVSRAGPGLCENSPASTALWRGMQAEVARLSPGTPPLSPCNASPGRSTRCSAADLKVCLFVLPPPSTATHPVEQHTFHVLLSFYFFCIFDVLETPEMWRQQINTKGSFHAHVARGSALLAERTPQALRRCSAAAAPRSEAPPPRFVFSEEVQEGCVTDFAPFRPFPSRERERSVSNVKPRRPTRMLCPRRA